MSVLIHTCVDIDAPAAAAWSVLTDFPAHPLWNPFIARIEGVVSVGQKLDVALRGRDGAGMRFRPVVTVVNPGVELRWLGRLLLPRIFDGEHFFRLEPLPDGRSRFHHGENFSGVIAPFFRKALERDAQQGFEAMNAAFKARVERIHGLQQKTST